VPRSLSWMSDICWIQSGACPLPMEVLISLIQQPCSVELVDEGASDPVLPMRRRLLSILAPFSPNLALFLCLTKIAQSRTFLLSNLALFFTMIFCPISHLFCPILHFSEEYNYKYSYSYSNGNIAIKEYFDKRCEIGQKYNHKLVNFISFKGYYRNSRLIYVFSPLI
jgi:hypothetical protein